MGALMSCGYCSISIAMSLRHVAREGPATTMAHHLGLSTADRVFGIFNALGGVAFTFGGESLYLKWQAIGPGSAALDS